MAASRKSDVLVCFDYSECLLLGEMYGKPLLLYDGMQYGSGLLTGMAHDLPALRELVEHDVFVQERLQQNALRRYEVYSPEANGTLTSSLRTLVVTNDPWNAESIFFRTGLRVPSARVVSYYLTCRYQEQSARSREVFLMNDRGRCTACVGFFSTMQFVVPENYPLQFFREDSYTDYCTLATRFRGMIVVPHGNVMQMLCFEAANMAVPVLLPDLRLLSRQPFLWWSERIVGTCGEDELCLAELRDPPKPKGFERPHPFPFLVSTMKPQGSEYVKAILYWMRLMDYFHWDWSLHFESIPHLLDMLLQDSMLLEASRRQKHFARQEKLRSRKFWHEGLGKLLA